MSLLNACNNIQRIFIRWQFRRLCPHALKSIYLHIRFSHHHYVSRLTTEIDTILIRIVKKTIVQLDNIFYQIKTHVHIPSSVWLMTWINV